MTLPQIPQKHLTAHIGNLFILPLPCLVNSGSFHAIDDDNVFDFGERADSFEKVVGLFVVEK